MTHAPARLLVVTFPLLAAGCARWPVADTPVDRIALKRQALECLHTAIRYPRNPVVRVEAVEALESSGLDQALPWIRAALLDEHPAVRFAACVAIGRRRDAGAVDSVRLCVKDEDASVQVAALFALHRLGQQDQTGRMPDYLLNHDDVTVRRNAALVLGLLEEPSAIRVLARAVKDPDRGVRDHALEAMARLGNPEARQELTFMTNAGVGSEEVFALTALAGTGDRRYLDTLRYKLATGAHLETRLAAARGLGRLDADDGIDIALRALRLRRAPLPDPKDPAPGQVLRIRQMAAAALGAIGRVDALPALARLLDEDTDPRLRVSAARAILEILAVERAQALPLASAG